ncbi:MAG: ATP-binding protein [Oscillospiraceae bacterium]|nr:ATP-binding protein [Oscillospiraceae bacterium]
MMPELSLNILDVAKNSVTAGASLIRISVLADTGRDQLTISIADNGCGMTEEQVQKVTDPFFTTRTTRKVGLGVPFFKMAAELTGGSFRIDSKVGEGTETVAVFGLSSIDRMPLGDFAGTITTLIQSSPEIDFLVTYGVDENQFVMDTREFREILGGVSLAEPEVLAYIGSFLEENMSECGAQL